MAKLLARSLDLKRIKAKRWSVQIFLLMPEVSAVVYGLMDWMAVPLSAPQVWLVLAMLVFLTLLAGALGEELGWSGYVPDTMQLR